MIWASLAHTATGWLAFVDDGRLTVQYGPYARLRDAEIVASQLRRQHRQRVRQAALWEWA